MNCVVAAGLLIIVSNCGASADSDSDVHALENFRDRIVRGIPIHGNRPLKIGLLRSLTKIAGLSERDL